MKALVLCAGYGSRLGALCDSTPKALLDLGPMTILEHILGQIQRTTIQEVFINLHYRGQDIVDRIGNGSRFGLQIRYCHEAQLLGTAGSVGQLAKEVQQQDLLVHYGDIVSTQDLKVFCEGHRASKLAATILVHRRKGSNSFAFFGEADRIDRFLERPQMVPADADKSFAFSGICALSPECVRRIVEKGAKDLPADLFGELSLQSQLRGVRLSSFRVAVDSPARLEMARRVFASEVRQS